MTHHLSSTMKKGHHPVSDDGPLEDPKQRRRHHPSRTTGPVGPAVAGVIHMGRSNATRQMRMGACSPLNSRYLYIPARREVKPPRA